MEEYLEGKYQECIHVYEQILNEKKEILTNEEISMVYCNIAAAEFGLNLYRKCTQSCNQSLEYDKKCMRSYLIQAAAYIAMKKYEDARHTCESCLDVSNNYTDTQMVKQIKEYLTMINSMINVMPSSSRIIAEQTSALVSLPGKNSKKSNNTSSGITIEHLTTLRDQFISDGDEPGKVQRAYLAGARQNLSYATGEDVVDDLIGFGYLLVNSSRYNEAEELFEVLLKYKPDIYAAYIAIGTVRALQGKLQEAEKPLTTAISIRPREGEAWKRRGQIIAALGRTMEAFEDYNHAATLSNDPELYYQRGMLFQQIKNYRRALADYNKYNELSANRTPQLYNSVGVCQSQLGDVENAIISFKNAFEKDDTFSDAYLNYAQMHKEIGLWEKAEILYDEVLAKYSSQIHLPQFEKTIAQLYYLRSVLQYSLGKPFHALGYAKRFLDLITVDADQKTLKTSYTMKELIQSYTQLAMTYSSLGNYNDALKYYNLILAHEPENVCRVQKRLMFYYYSKLDVSLSNFNLDRDFDSMWKEIWSKGLAANPLDIPDSPLEKSTIYDLDAPENHTNMTLTPQQHKMFELACRFGPWVQINSRGFIPNLRLHRGFGLAVLEMAQALINNIDSIHRTGQPMMVPNASSSSKYYTKEGQHLFGYRDLFDIIVKWRQLSEPSDPVWWIDGLQRESFEEGFGLQTPMLSGQLRCIRYYSYFKMGFDVLRIQASEQYYLASSLPVTPSKNAKKKIKKAYTLTELYSIIGQDFYIVCPCHSLANSNLQSTVLEGTRLTVLKREPEGYEFTIRCPSMPIRWKAMSDEITECYDRMILSLYHLRYPDDNPHLEPSTPDPLYYSLLLFYYWTNFSPLTRGSAYCGYGVLYAIVLAFGYQITSPIPEGRQFDWEAIFTSHPEVFIQKMKPLLTIEPFPVEEINTTGALLTLRDMLKVLHWNMNYE